MTSTSDKIPKSKSQRVKYNKTQRVRAPNKLCAMCQKFGGAHTTHNSHECKKWDKVGNLKKDFKSQSKVIREAPPGARINYAQLYNQNLKRKASRHRAKKALQKASKKSKPLKRLLKRGSIPKLNLAIRTIARIRPRKLGRVVAGIIKT